jgi:hypothetical protein
MFKKLNISPEAQEAFRGMLESEKETFVDHITGIVLSMPDSEYSQYRCLEDAVDHVINQEAEKLPLKRQEEADRLFYREKIQRDMAGRFTGRPVAAHEESGDPSEQLDRLTRRIMAEKGVDYNAGLLEAQRQRKDLAEAILKQLNEYRTR